MTTSNPCRPAQRVAAFPTSGGALTTTTTSTAALTTARSDACCCCPCPVHVSPPPPSSTTSTTALLLVEIVDAFQRRQTNGINDDSPSANARPVDYIRSTNRYVASTDARQLLVYHSLTHRDTSNVPQGTPPVAPGERAWVIHHAASGRYELVRPALESARFQLSGTLSGGGSATASTVEWNGSSWGATTSILTVYDGLGSFSGGNGDRGWATFWPDSGRWEIQQMDNGCSSGTTTTLTVITDVQKSGADLIFTRRQLTLPSCVTITSLGDLTIEACCAE